MNAAALPALRFSDPAVFGRVAVLMGGTSSERSVSLDSGANVLAGLQASGIDAFSVDGIPALVAQIKAGKVKRVFNILHGGDGENGVVQGLLQSLGVPYTGSGVLGSALALDKIRTKQVWLSLGLPTPRYARLTPGDNVHAAAIALGLPVIIKPANEGSSFGISRVFESSQLADAAALAARYDDQLLMEQMVVGDELTVAVLGDVALPSIRIVPGGAWYDYNAKYVAQDTQYLCPGLSQADQTHLGQLAVDAFQAAGCHGWGRVDVMRDRQSGQLFLLEVNTAPGMTTHSLVPKAAAQAGIGFPELVWRVLEQTV